MNCPPRLILTLALLTVPVLTGTAVAQTPEIPKSEDLSLEVTLFAQEPLVQHPIGMTFTQDGKLLVIQSNTHFPPKNYAGPKHDRILWLRDDDKDGKAEKAEVFYEGDTANGGMLEATMDIATAPDGSIYVATRNEILRVWDKDGDGKADKADRRLVFLDSQERYPHNGLGGLAFDGKGGLYFGMGENMGAPYVIKGSDGSSHSGKVDGGNVFHSTMDGAKLRRVASGFWNPFGICLDGDGNVYATDNDPGSRPPNRLHHIIEGGDYGYKIRYGRSGLHPFVSWNGQIPGTLPMLAGTGEAACDLIYYAPKPTKDFRGLSAEWHGQLLVASWVDHTVEAYVLPDREHAYGTASKKILVRGGVDFRPVGFAVAADGSIYVSDWVKRDYELHGHGRVWRIAAKKAQTLAGPLAGRSGISWKQEQINRILNKAKVTPLEAADWLNEANPWLFSAAITRLSQDTDLLWALKGTRFPYPRQRQGLLLAVQRDAERTGAEPLLTPQSFLMDTDETVQLLALKWITDTRYEPARKDVQRLLDSSEGTPATLLYAAITALTRLDAEEVKEPDLVKMLKGMLKPSAPRAVRTILEIMPDRETQVRASDLQPLIDGGDAETQEWLVHVLGSVRDNNRVALLKKLAFDEKRPSKVRAAALMYVTLTEEERPLLAAMKTEGDVLLTRAKRLAAPDYLPATPPSTRPPLQDIAAWEKYLSKVPGKADLEHGREVFFHPRLGGCALCHRAEGLGNVAGPNLSSIGSAKDGNYSLESVLQPNRNVAPQFESYVLTTIDGQTRTVFPLAEHAGTHTYIGLDGRTFQVKIEEITQRAHYPLSIMPEGLVGKLSDTEVRDLVVWLNAQKK